MENHERNTRRPRGAFAPLALLALVMTAGCAGPPQMTNVWKDPTFTGGPMRNALIVALRKEPARRRLWEDAFAKELNDRGVTATSSYQLFPDAPPDTQDVIDAIQKHGFDAVLTSVRLPNQETSTYVPTQVRSESVTTRDYYGIFHSHWRDVLDPAHTEVDAIIRVETDLWMTGNPGRLVWSGTFRTLESSTNRTVESAVSTDIAPTLEEQRLLPKRK